MEKEIRIKGISELRPTGIKKEIRYDNKMVPYDIYEVPLELLVFNKYNGRIMSKTKSFETRYKRQLDTDSIEDTEIIKQFLWESSAAQNEHTYESLLLHEQLECGIITRDGIIIDGNRRASILMKINADKGISKTFKTIILKETLEDNPKKITDLETFYQIGIDVKVDYNAIEKYLKCEFLMQYHTIKDVSFLMSETESKINEWLRILLLMKEYLSYHGLTDQYDQLEKKEGHFVDLRIYLNNYENKIQRSSSVDWEYNEEDLLNLKHAYFDYIFSGMPVAECRIIARSAKSNSFFCHFQIWDEFWKSHIKQTGIIKIELGRLGSEKEKIFDKKLFLYKANLLEHFNIASFKLNTIKDLNTPLLLLKRANNALLGVDLKILDKSKNGAQELIVSIENQINAIKNA